ncbi:MAG TPA: transposase [Streptosporangiaceae bacterium]|jgi:ribosomal protein L37AE/L43A|nr:transposase [Streptosporangiaceae bacterium]
MSSVSDSVFVCPGTGCTPPPPRKRCCGILASGWGLLVRQLEEKAPSRVEKINPVFTSQRCSACGQVDRGSRESQAVFRCTACGFAGHADVNAAINIAAGHAVTARGGDGITRPVNREPQLLLPTA